MIGENSVEYVNALLDIWNNNDCAVLIDWRIPFKTAVKMMAEAGVTRCCIESGKLDNKIDIFPDSIELEVFERPSNSAELLPQYIYDKYCDNYSNDEAVVIYSSGTTGTSKGIILSHYAIQTNADAIIDYMNPSLGDCIYIAKVMSHSSTLTGELLVALKSGMKAVIAPTIVPPRFIISQIEQHNVSVICLNPTLLNYISDEYGRHDYDLSSLRVIYVSGSVLNDRVYNKSHHILKEIPIYNVYGLSEAGPTVSAQRVDCCKSNSVGKPILGVEIVVADKNGNVLPNRERGMIHVNTQSRYCSYITGEEKHKSVYKDWLNTGDIGYFDEYGELHIVGRMDDVILLGAHKIYPNDVVAQIMKYTDIHECAVTAVSVNTEDVLCCLYTSSSDVRVDIKKLGTVLMKHEVPKIFIRTGAIPKTRTGKISLQLVREVMVKELNGRKIYDS